MKKTTGLLLPAIIGIFFACTFPAISYATDFVSDSFTGTTIDTTKWTETDSASSGSGGTAGNVQQNGALTIVGTNTWGTNMLVSKGIYSRAMGSLSLDADVTLPNCTGGVNTIPGLGFGGPAVTTAGQPPAYTVYYLSNKLNFAYHTGGVSQQNITTSFGCTANTLFHIKITLEPTTGAKLYINGSGTAAATLTLGTFDDAAFFLQNFGGTGTATIDNVVISGTSLIAPKAPTSLAATPSNASVILTWTAPVGNGGSDITDYLVEYKLASEPTTWTTFSDGVSSTTGATVTSLTNGQSYNFRVSAINAIGTGTVSSTATATPDLLPPSAPQSLAATALTDGSVSLTWSVPITDAGFAITDYVVEYKRAVDGSWTTFSDGTSTSTSATVNELINNTSYNFRVSASNANGTGVVSNTATVTALYYAVLDDFTGTTIDTLKWTETDSASGGSGGTAGNVQQNGALTITGSGAWGANRLVSVDTFSRASGIVSLDADITQPNCVAGVNTVPGIGFGDPNITNGGSDSYTIYYAANRLHLSRQSGGVTVDDVTTAFPCVNNTLYHIKLTIEQTTGAKLYINGSGTAAATIAGGTFDNKSFFLQSHTGVLTVDNVQISEAALVGPFRPASLVATPGDGEVALTWAAAGPNGSAITDYIVEYKRNSASSWTTFSDGTSTATSATVTGLTNGLNYNFRVSAVNGNGTSRSAYQKTAMPVTAAAAEPSAADVSFSGTLTIGNVLTGAYEYLDPNGDTEGVSTYRWLRSDTLGGTYSAIDGQTTTSHTVTYADVGKYLKFEVAPVATVAPLTGTSIESSASLIPEPDFINHIISTGHSVSIGYATGSALTTTQPYSNLMLSGGNGGLGTGTSLIPLVQATVETPSSGMANTITANAGGDFDVAVTLNGMESATYQLLKKGSARYTIAMSQLANAKSAAIALGRVDRVIGVTAILGAMENFNDLDGETYQGYMEELQADYEADIQAVTTQPDPVPLFLSQISSFMSSFANNATSEIPIAQLAAAEDNPGKIYLVAPEYFFNYSDRHHLTAASSRWLGEYFGKVIEKVVVDGEEWRPLVPDSVDRDGAVISASFHVPEGVLAFDTTGVVERENYGFEYYDSDASATITSVEIASDDVVRITLSNVPTGSDQRLRYAYTGVPGTDTGGQNLGTAAGNLRDTDSYPSLYGNTLYNWAVHFDEPIRDRSAASSTPGAAVIIPVQIRPTLPVTGETTNTQTGASSSAFLFTRNLQERSTGLDVLALQQFLNKNGFTVAKTGVGSPGKETTYFGRATTAALAAYQRAKNISPASGYFGAKTRALVAASGNSTRSTSGTPSGGTVFSRDLSTGVSGTDVMDLQKLLIEKDSGPAARALAANGTSTYFGALTKAALAEYQAALNIFPAFGYFGPKTRTALSGQ